MGLWETPNTLGFFAALGTEPRAPDTRLARYHCATSVARFIVFKTLPPQLLNPGMTDVHQCPAVTLCHLETWAQARRLKPGRAAVHGTKQARVRPWPWPPGEEHPAGSLTALEGDFPMCESQRIPTHVLLMLSK